MKQQKLTELKDRMRMMEKDTSPYNEYEVWMREIEEYIKKIMKGKKRVEEERTRLDGRIDCDKERCSKETETRQGKYDRTIKERIDRDKREKEKWKRKNSLL